MTSWGAAVLEPPAAGLAAGAGRAGAAPWPRSGGVGLEERWWSYAVDLFVGLAAGRPVPVVPVRSPGGEPVQLDAWFDCASWYAVDVPPRQRSGVFAGSPLVVAVAMAATAAADRRDRERAAAASAPQWRPHGQVQVLLDANATWVGRCGDWRRFLHSTVAGIDVGAMASVIQYGQVPVRLSGPAVWAHAVLTTFWGPGPGRWVEAPHLEPVQRAAVQRARATGMLA